MDYFKMTAPCGLDCFDCHFFLAHTKVYNLCLINKMGLEKWAKTKALKVRRDYFNKPWSLA